MQKRIVRIIVGYCYRESCRDLFKKLKILTVSSQYIFSLLLFIVNIGITLSQTVYTVRSKSSRTKAIKTKNKKACIFFFVFIQNRIYQM
jgi:hypothetical protein